MILKDDKKIECYRLCFVLLRMTPSIKVSIKKDGRCQASLSYLFRQFSLVNNVIMEVGAIGSWR